MKKVFLAWLVMGCTSLILAGVGRREVSAILDEDLEYFSQENVPIATALQALGKAKAVSIIADPDVVGNVSLEMTGTTVRGVLDAILKGGGFVFSVEGSWIRVQRFQSRFFVFDYPQVSRTGSSSSVISMGGQGNTVGGSGGLGAAVFGGGVGVSPVGGTGDTRGSGGQDSTQIQIQQKSDADFWQTIETQLKGMLSKDESLVLNRFSGVLQVKAGSETMRQIEGFVALVNERIGAQVEIVAKIVEVRLSNEKKLGIDWSSAAFTIGRNLKVGSSVVIGGQTISGLNGLTNVTQAGEFQFSPDSLSGTVSNSGVDVVIRALESQGDVKVTSEPRLRLLNNQTGYIKDATDRPFFRLSSNVTINAGGLPSAGAQPITQTQYQTQTISIGTVLPVTAQISRDGEVTLDVAPALTRLREIVTSPDKLQTAPVLDVKQTSTIIRVKSGETAVIGGLITESESQTQRSVPGLGSLPGVGRLFRSDGKVSQRTELVIFLTPNVVRPATTTGPVTTLVP